nr:hypothetical protein WG33_0279 [uncultured bacterium]
MLDALIDLAFVAMPLPLIGGIALQVLALRRFSGGWLAAAWVPALAMGAALAVAVLGVMVGSNLAPIWVVFAIPLCLVWLVALWLARGIAVWVRG